MENVSAIKLTNMNVFVIKVSKEKNVTTKKIFAIKECAKMGQCVEQQLIQIEVLIMNVNVQKDIMAETVIK